MLTMTRSKIQWKFGGRPLLRLVIVCLLVLSGISGGTTLNLAQGSGGQDDLDPQQAFADVLSLAIDPKDPSTLYAGVNRRGVFKSTDGGAGWQAINAGLPNAASPQALIIHPTTPSTLFVGIGRNVFKSTDAGASWQATNLFQSVTTMAIDPQDPQRLYAVGACDGASRSDDEGTNWMGINRGLGYSVFGFPATPYITSLVIDPLVPSTLYAGSVEAIFKTADRGASWRMVFVGFNFFVPVSGVTALAIDPLTPTTVYAGLTGNGEFKGSGCELSVNSLPSGVIKSLDRSGRWSDASAGLPYAPVVALAVDPTLPLTVYAGTTLGAFKSNDAGGSWAAVNTGLPGGAVRALIVDPQTPSTVYAGTTQGVFKSTNGGDQWDAAGPLF